MSEMFPTDKLTPQKKEKKNTHTTKNDILSTSLVSHKQHQPAARLHVAHCTFPRFHKAALITKQNLPPKEMEVNSNVIAVEVSNH